MIGLDGTPFSLLRTLSSTGELPHLKRIFDSGTLLPMTTTLPEISSVAWPAFMTGKNPAKHGIFGFTDLKPNSYNLYFPNSKNIRSETLWDILGRQSKRTIAINIPSTYPAKEINGILIAGFVALDLEKAVYPKLLAPQLKEMDYRIDIDLARAQTSKDYLIDALNQSLETRANTILRFLDREEWDLFIGVITETDRLHHFLWDALDNGDSPHRQAFMDIYKKIDTFVGKIHERIDKNTLFILMSDHGFCRVKKQVYLNRWLENHEYLSYTTEAPTSISDIDGKNTKAFCLDPGRLYINLGSRFPDGSVADHDYGRLRQQLKEELVDLRLRDGSEEERVVDQVFFREEIYEGPHIKQAPDLVVLPHRGWDLKGSTTKNVLADIGPWTGMHTFDDAACFINRDINQTDLRIFDIAQTILNHFNVEKTAAMDGRCLISVTRR